MVELSEKDLVVLQFQAAHDYIDEILDTMKESHPENPEKTIITYDQLADIRDNIYREIENAS